MILSTLLATGVVDQMQPFESGFAMGGRLLKVENIMRYELADVQFAYLSACHTIVGGKGSPDEVIRLAAATQFAGFGSVIGTTWAVDDAQTKEIMSKPYANMFRSWSGSSGVAQNDESVFAFEQGPIRSANPIHPHRCPVFQLAGV